MKSFTSRGGEKTPPTSRLFSFLKPLVFAASFFPLLLSIWHACFDPLGARRLAQSCAGASSPGSTAVLKLLPHRVPVAAGCWKVVLPELGAPIAVCAGLCAWDTAGGSWASFGAEGGRGGWLCIHHAVQREFQCR